MNIPPEQISYKKKIGTIGQAPVWEVSTIGGLHLVIATRDGKAETLGVGPHRAVARHIAKKREPTLEITELSKSDWYPESSYSHVLDKYETMTTTARRLQGLED